MFWCPTLVPHFKFRSFLPPAPTLVPPVVSSLSSRSQRSTERRSLVSNCGMQSSTPYKTSRNPSAHFFSYFPDLFPFFKSASPSCFPLCILFTYDHLLLLPTQVPRRLHTRCIIRRVPTASGTPKRNAAPTHSTSAYPIARSKHRLPDRSLIIVHLDFKKAETLSSEFIGAKVIHAITDKSCVPVRPRQ